jgi:hypothetical protein
LEELQELWELGTPNGKFQQRAKRLILFAPDCYLGPDCYSWNDIVVSWNRVYSNSRVRPGDGCEEITANEIIAEVAHDICGQL